MCEFLFAYIQDQLDSQLDDEIIKKVIKKSLNSYFNRYRDYSCFNNKVKSVFPNKIVAQTLKESKDVFSI